MAAPVFHAFFPAAKCRVFFRIFRSLVPPRASHHGTISTHCRERALPAVSSLQQRHHASMVYRTVAAFSPAAQIGSGRQTRLRRIQNRLSVAGGGPSGADDGTSTRRIASWFSAGVDERCLGQTTLQRPGISKGRRVRSLFEHCGSVCRIAYESAREAVRFMPTIGSSLKPRNGRCLRFGDAIQFVTVGRRQAFGSEMSRAASARRLFA